MTGGCSQPLVSAERRRTKPRKPTQALQKQVRDNWLAIYATFTPDQKAVVKNAIGQRIARMEQMRQKFHAAEPQS